jgi:hypothetical protein
MEVGKDFYTIFKEGVEYRVLTEEYLARRGFCCANRCTNCPYWPQYTKGSTELREDVKKKMKNNL